MKLILKKSFMIVLSAETELLSSMSLVRPRDPALTGLMAKFIFMKENIRQVAGAGLMGGATTIPHHIDFIKM